MERMRGSTDDGTFAVELQASVLEELDRYCRDAGSVETGGILVGRYSDDLALAIVCEATPPPTDSKRGRSWFVRGMSGLREMLNNRWKASVRTFYIGEWHFHPADHVEPSGDDFAQMLAISRAQEYDCKAPILLILGDGKHEGHRIFRAFVCPAEHAPLEFHCSPAEQQASSETGDDIRDDTMPCAVHGTTNKRRSSNEKHSEATVGRTAMWEMAHPRAHTEPNLYPCSELSRLCDEHEIQGSVHGKSKLQANCLTCADPTGKR